MSATKILGAILIMSPIVAIAIYAVRVEGVRFAFQLFAVAVGILGILVLGTHLWKQG